VRKIKKILFNNRCIYRLLVVQPQNVWRMRVKVVQTNLCAFQVISRLLWHEFQCFIWISTSANIENLCRGTSSHTRNVLRLYDKQTVDTPIIEQNLFNSTFHAISTIHVEFNQIYFNFLSLTVFAVSPLKKQVNHSVHKLWRIFTTKMG
jgi:hypothetical protein